MPKTLLQNGSQVHLPDAQQLKSASQMIRAINHPQRLKVLKTLHQKKVPPSPICTKN